MWGWVRVEVRVQVRYDSYCHLSSCVGLGVGEGGSEGAVT